jgi:hypothetical protein
VEQAAKLPPFFGVRFDAGSIHSCGFAYFEEHDGVIADVS